MAKVDFYTSIGYYESVCNYIASLDPRLTVIGDGTISVDGKFNIQMGGLANTSVEIIINSTTYSGVSIRCFEGYHIYSAISDNMIFIKIFNQEMTRCDIIMYLKVGNKYYGGIDYKSEEGNPISINTITLREVGSTVTGYIPKLINFVLPAGEIAYSQYAPFASAPTDGSVYSYIAELVSTSTLTLDGVISMGNHNYYSIGTNTMIAIDQ